MRVSLLLQAALLIAVCSGIDAVNSMQGPSPLLSAGTRTTSTTTAAASGPESSNSVDDASLQAAFVADKRSEVGDKKHEQELQAIAAREQAKIEKQQERLQRKLQQLLSTPMQQPQTPLPKPKANESLAVSLEKSLDDLSPGSVQMSVPANETFNQLLGGVDLDNMPVAPTSPTTGGAISSVPTSPRPSSPTGSQSFQQPSSTGSQPVQDSSASSQSSAAAKNKNPYPFPEPVDAEESEMDRIAEEQKWAPPNFPSNIAHAGYAGAIGWPEQKLPVPHLPPIDLDVPPYTPGIASLNDDEKRLLSKSMANLLTSPSRPGEAPIITAEELRAGNATWIAIESKKKEMEAEILAEENNPDLAMEAFEDIPYEIRQCLERPQGCLCGRCCNMLCTHWRSMLVFQETIRSHGSCVKTCLKHAHAEPTSRYRQWPSLCRTCIVPPKPKKFVPPVRKPTTSSTPSSTQTAPTVSSSSSAASSTPAAPSATTAPKL